MSETFATGDTVYVKAKYMYGAFVRLFDGGDGLYVGASEQLVSGERIDALAALWDAHPDNPDRPYSFTWATYNKAASRLKAMGTVKRADALEAVAKAAAVIAMDGLKPAGSLTSLRHSLEVLKRSEP